jgi:pyrophosphatase PpaX
MKFNNFLFDWDGTLVKSLDVWLEAYKEVLKSRNIEGVTDRDITSKAFGKWQKGLENIGIIDSDIAINELIAIANTNMKNLLLYENVVETLTHLKNSGAKLAIISSSPRDMLDFGLKKYDLEKYFEIIVTRHDVVNGKPHREMVDKVLNTINGDISQTVIIGDTESDIQTAKNSGAKSILYYPNHNQLFYDKEYLMKYNPDIVIGNLLDLKDFI